MEMIVIWLAAGVLVFAACLLLVLLGTPSAPPSRRIEREHECEWEELE